MRDDLGVRPRFSVVIPVLDRADVIGRAVAGVLAQSFADLEVLVVDRGSSDATVDAVHTVADHRVRVVHLHHEDEQPRAVHDDHVARTCGVHRAKGRWITTLDPDDEVSPAWLARLGRVIDTTDAEVVCCGGEQHHRDGSSTRIVPLPVTSGLSPVDRPPTPAEEWSLPRVCFRPGALVATRRLMVQVGAFGTEDDPRPLDDVGARLVDAAIVAGHHVGYTPDRLVHWNDPTDEPAPTGDELRLRWSLQGIDAVARAPIPDGALLARYAVHGGVAAARLRERDEARRLFRLARRLEPRVARHWARWAATLLPPVADRVWDGSQRSAAGVS